MKVGRVAVPKTLHLSRELAFDSHKANLLAQAFTARVCRAIKSLLKAPHSLSTETSYSVYAESIHGTGYRQPLWEFCPAKVAFRKDVLLGNVFYLPVGA